MGKEITWEGCGEQEEKRNKGRAKREGDSQDLFLVSQFLASEMPPATSSSLSGRESEA